MPSANLTLGGVVLTSFEVPDQIAFGGDQALVVHKLVGGQRIIDAMGRDDSAIEWSGRFVGTNALSRAQYFDELRIAGQPLSLSWAQSNYTVVIKSFRPVYQQDMLIPYTITVEVMTDNATPITPSDAQALNDMMAADMNALTAQMAAISAVVAANAIANALSQANIAALALIMQITGWMNAVTAANSAISSISGSSRAGLAPLNSAITGMIGATTAIGAGIFIADGSVGGMVAGLAPSVLATTLAGQVTNAGLVPALSIMTNTLTRMQTNISQVGVGGATFVVSGQSLYQVATQQYGAIEGWTAIGKANGITDPMATTIGVTTLTVPANPADTSSGILAA